MKMMEKIKIDQNMDQRVLDNCFVHLLTYIFVLNQKMYFKTYKKCITEKVLNIFK